jgi:phosphate transport system substrate-binding protein
MAGPSRLTPFSRLLIAVGIAGGIFYAVKKFLPQTKSNGSTSAVAAVPETPKTGKGNKATAILTFSGSGTLGATLIPKMAQQFMTNELSGQNVQIQKISETVTEIVGTIGGNAQKIVVNAAGSAQGMNDVLSKKADIAMLSSALDGVSADLNSTVVALDGIAVVVNNANPVKELKKQQVRDIFTGKITDWSQVGGTKGAIKCQSRDSKSGTFDAFNTMILDKNAMVAGVGMHENAGALIKAVTADAGAIGFTSFSELGGTRALGIGENGASIKYPSVFTIQTEDYSLSRRLYLLAPKTGANAVAQQFVSYAQADTKGQKVVAESGFVNMDLHNANPTQQTVVKTSDTPPQYVAATTGASRLPTTLHFKTASSIPDERAMADLERVKKLISETQNRSKRLILIGFTDNQGDPKANLALSVQRAQSIQSEFAKAGITATSAGFGPALPIADNALPAGKDKNRRVEVWMK